MIYPDCPQTCETYTVLDTSQYSALHLFGCQSYYGGQISISSLQYVMSNIYLGMNVDTTVYSVIMTIRRH